MQQYGLIVLVVGVILVQMIRKCIKKLTFKPFPMPPLPQAEFVQQKYPFKGQRLQMVECFATWCGPCRRMVPHLNQLQKTYGDKMQLTAVSDEPASHLQQFIEQNNIKYNVMSSQVGKELMSKCDAMGIPFCCLFLEKMLVWHGHPSAVEGEIKKYLTILEDGNQQETAPKKDE